MKLSFLFGRTLLSHNSHVMRPFGVRIFRNTHSPELVNGGEQHRYGRQKLINDRKTGSNPGRRESKKIEQMSNRVNVH